MVSQTSNPHEGGSMPKTGARVPTDAAKQNTIPPVPHPDQRIESDYLTKGGTVKPSLPTDDNNNHMRHSSADEIDTASGHSMSSGVKSHRGSMAIDIPNVPRDPRDTKDQKANRREYDQFVGDNDLKGRADTGKVGVQQFFGIESSY